MVALPLIGTLDSGRTMVVGIRPAVAIALVEVRLSLAA